MAPYMHVSYAKIRLILNNYNYLNFHGFTIGQLPRKIPKKLNELQVETQSELAKNIKVVPGELQIDTSGSPHIPYAAAQSQISPTPSSVGV